MNMTNPRGHQQELETMISGFRVSELHTFLTWAGESRSGKKIELIMRANDVLRSRYNVQMESKIRELYCHARPGLTPAHTGVSAQYPPGRPSPAHQAPSPHNQHQQPQHNHHHHHHHNSVSNNRSPRSSSYLASSHNHGGVPGHHHGHHGNHYNPHLQQLNGECPCRECERTTNTISQAYNNQIPSAALQNIHQRQVTQGVSTRIQQTAPVELKSLPFYDVIDHLVRPAGLIPATRMETTLNNSHLTFKLTPIQADSIAQSQISPNVFGRQVLIRFCKWDNSGEQEDNFPDNICLKVNDSTVPLPPIPHNPNKPPHELKRPGRPLDVTSYVKISPYNENLVGINWSIDRMSTIKSYVINITLVERLDSRTLLSRLDNKGLREPDKTRALVREKLASDADGDIATDVMRVSLMCPLGKIRMRKPCRSDQCRHIQCFDALVFLSMNEKKPSWICPVCDKPALYRDLMIDGLLMEILQVNSDSTTEVEFFHDGSYGAVGKKDAHSKPRSAPSGSPPQKRACVQLDMDDDDDMQDDNFRLDTKQNILQQNQIKSVQSEVRRPAGNAIEVVTISDSSDEDDDDDDDATEKDDDETQEEEEASPDSPTSSRHTIVSVCSTPELPQLSLDVIERNVDLTDTGFMY